MKALLTWTKDRMSMVCSEISAIYSAEDSFASYTNASIIALKVLPVAKKVQWLVNIKNTWDENVARKWNDGEDKMALPGSFCWFYSFLNVDSELYCRWAQVFFLPLCQEAPWTALFKQHCPSPTTALTTSIFFYLSDSNLFRSHV